MQANYDDVSVLSLEGPLVAPMTTRLRRSVEALLGKGERDILLDMAGVPEIDAAGVGELVRAYAMTTGVDGSFGIANPPRRVRQILDRVRLLDVLRPVNPSDVSCRARCA